MSFIGFIIIGIVAGWIAGLVMKGGGYGLWGDLLLGIIGAFVGGWLTGLLLGTDLVNGFNLTSLIVSVVGAIVVIAVYRLITRRTLARP